MPKNSTQCHCLYNCRQILLQRICYSHWANGAWNGVISIGQRGVFNHEKAPPDSPIWQLKKRELLLPLSFLITKPIKLDLSNLHYGPHYEPHYRTQGCVIRENNITAPIKDTLVPLPTNFNANWSIGWCTYVYLNLFQWPLGKILVIIMGLVDTFQPDEPSKGIKVGSCFHVLQWFSSLSQ